MKRTITIVVIIAILVAIGVYFYRANRVTEDTTTSESDVSPQSDGGVATGDATTDSTKAAAGTAQQNGTVAGASTDEKFNLAMTNARKAFVANHFNEAVDQYKKALKYDEDDTAYVGLYTVYGAQGKWGEAVAALDRAITLNPQNTDYRKWKIGYMDEHTDATFDTLKTTFEQALPQVDVATQVNLITYFAGVAESNHQISYAISYWQQAIEINPANKTIYQAEIDRLKSM